MMPRPRFRTLLPLLLIFCHPGRGASQSSPSTLHPGDEVQVHAPAVRSSRVRGTVVLYQGATLQVREEGSGSVVSIPIEDIRLLARNEGRDRSRSSWWTARLGAFIGGAGGLAAGPLIATTRAPEKFTEVTLASGLVGAAAGAGAGAVLGALFARDHWQRFRMPIVPTVSASAGTVRLGIVASMP